MKYLYLKLQQFWSHCYLWIDHSASITQQALLSDADLQAIRDYAKSLPYSLFNHIQQAASQRIGEVPSFFRGQGLEFEENRPYQNGDEQRLINWRLYARTQTLYSKIYTEERKQQAYLVIDRRANMRFATRKQLKVTLATKLALCYLFQAKQQSINVGACVLNERTSWIESVQRDSFQTLAQALTSAASPLPFDSEQQNLEETLKQLLQRIRSGSYIVIISDFSDLDPSATTSLITQLAAKHTVKAIQIYDPVERQLPQTGNIVIEDKHSASPIIINTQDELLQKRYSRTYEKHQSALSDLFHKNGIDIQVFSTEDEYTACMGAINAG